MMSSVALLAGILALAGGMPILDTRAASGSDLGAPGVAAAVPPAMLVGWSNRRIAKTAAATVVGAEQGGTIALGGNAFYRLAFGKPAEYPPAFTVVVLNEDAGRAKFIALSGAQPFYLWPLQLVAVFNQNNVWQTMGRAKWLLPTGPVTIHTDFAHGSDEYGKADGLETGRDALKTVHHAVYFANDQFCWNPDGGTPGPGHGLQTRVTVLMAPGSMDLQPVHYAMHGIRGAQGGAALTIDLNGGVLSGDARQPALLVALGFLRIRNGTFSAPKTGAVDVMCGGRLYLEDGLTFGAIGPGGAHVRLFPGGFARFVHDYTIAAGNAAGYHIINMNGSLHSGGALTMTIAADVSFVNTYLGTELSYGNLGALSVRLNGHTVKTQCPVRLDGNSVLSGSAKVPGTGTVSVTHGGQAL
jgi:hypothetical protein